MPPNHPGHFVHAHLPKNMFDDKTYSLPATVSRFGRHIRRHHGARVLFEVYKRSGVAAKFLLVSRTSLFAYCASSGSDFLTSSSVNTTLMTASTQTLQQVLRWHDKARVPAARSRKTSGGNGAETYLSQSFISPRNPPLTGDLKTVISSVCRVNLWRNG